MATPRGLTGHTGESGQGSRREARRVRKSHRFDFGLTVRLERSGRMALDSDEIIHLGVAGPPELFVKRDC